MLIPYARNARLHSEDQIAAIAGSMREFGFTNPILIDERRGIIAGHGRVMAAQKLGMDDVPCIVVSGLNDAQRRALILADNRIALSASWDPEMLAVELTDLAAENFDTGLIGFSAEELAALSANNSAGLIPEA